MGSSSKQSQSQQQSTSQVDNRIGLSDSAVLAQGGGTAVGAGGTYSTTTAGRDVVFQSLDAQVVSEALGISRDVAGKLVDFASEASLGALGANTDVSLGALETNAGVSRDAFDLARDVTGQALDVQAESQALAFDFGSDVVDKANEFGIAGLGTVDRAIDAVADANAAATQLSERTSAELGSAFERFGTELSQIKAAEVTGGASESNKLITQILIGAVVIVLGFLFARKGKA